MNEQILRAIRSAVRAAPTAALATGIFCPAALGDPGDLDPTFADVGRFLALDVFGGRARAVDVQDDAIVFAGGEEVEYFYSSDIGTRGFAGRLSSTGTLDTGFDAADLADIDVLDAALQPDGKIAGIGRRKNVYLVFLLERDGALDASFGMDGIRELTDVSGLGSLAVDPGGTVVVAGWLASDLKVLRLLASGDLDESFGTAGVFTASADSENETILKAPRILTAENGGYRITDNDYVTSGVSRCRVLALTTEGTVDESFGDHGYAGLASPSGSITCNSLVELPEGRLLVGGAEGAQPLVVRLIASGAVDPTFAADDLADSTMREATALAVDPNSGSVALAGYGPEDGTPGFLVARLNADGSLDPQFGTGGATWVDLPPEYAAYPFAADVTVLPNSDLLVTGGARPEYSTSTPFVARLVGGDDNDGPGVLGVTSPYVPGTEDAQQAVITVRRMAGKAGAVSVAYAARAAGDSVWEATEGEDFTAASGRLDWADGDASDKQILIAIAADAGAPEEQESFALVLSDVQGGAGLGTSVTTVAIQSDAPAAGMFAIESGDLTVSEGQGTAQFYVSRVYSSSGAVSVTMTLTPDTATEGDDFAGEPLTVSWADGDSEWKYVDIPIVNDSSREPSERFTLQLSDPTGGAVVGPRSVINVSIEDDDPLRQGGGGRTGMVSLLLLALASWVRVRR